MVRVITYGSYDLLHYGHIRLLERAKALGDYLIVGVTSDDYDRSRGKINIQQSLMERVEAVRATGLADEIIIEEYEGQKIDDIKKYNVDIFTVGSDWAGCFDYLSEYCEIIYLPRTEGISSSEIREKNRAVRLWLVGDGQFLKKVWKESKFVNGLKVTSVYTKNPDIAEQAKKEGLMSCSEEFEGFLSNVEAVYIRSHPQEHYAHIKQALQMGKHVLCELPMTVNADQYKELIALGDEKHLILMEAVKTAYATAYARLLLLIKAGKIGKVVSVDSVCTSIRNSEKYEWDSIYEWGPTALLPIFQILGTDYNSSQIVTQAMDNHSSFTKIDFIYDHAIASIKVGDGVKSEGEMIISGTDGYIYVPAPWWKTDYFEVRFENPAENKRYFYQLEGEGIRYELVAFTRAIERGTCIHEISSEITAKISEIMHSFDVGLKVIKI